MNKELLEVLSTGDKEKLAKLTEAGVVKKELLALLRSDNTEMLEKFIKAGINITTTIQEEGDNDTPLFFVASFGKVPMLEYLLKKGHAKITERNHNQQTAIIMAVREGNVETADYLLNKGYATMDETDRFELTPLLWAARCGHTSILKLLLEKHNAIIPHTTNDRDNVLFQAAEQGNVQALSYLLEKGAYFDPEQADWGTDEPKIFDMIMLIDRLWASAMGEKFVPPFHVFTQKLGKGLNARQTDTGNSAFHLAILHNQYTMAFLLLKNGGDKNLPNKQGDTPLSLIKKSQDPYFIALNAYIALSEFEENWQNLKNQSSVAHTEIKELKENKENKEKKENKEIKEDDDFGTVFTQDLQNSIKKVRETLNKVKALFDTPASKEVEELILKIAKILINTASPLTDPGLAYELLNSCANSGPQDKSSHSAEMHKMMMDLLISKKVMVSLENRTECIVRHMLQTEPEHRQSLPRYIADYIYMDENSFSQMNGVTGKDTDLILTLMKINEKQVEAQRKIEKENQKSLNDKNKEKEQLQLELKKQREEAQRLKKQLLELENQAQKQSNSNKST